MDPKRRRQDVINTVDLPTNSEHNYYDYYMSRVYYLKVLLTVLYKVSWKPLTPNSNGHQYLTHIPVASMKFTTTYHCSHTENVDVRLSLILKRSSNL
jgi:hypothetical protein